MAVKLSSFEDKKPIALDTGGKELSFSDLQAGKVPVNLAVLEFDQKSKLVLERMVQDEDYEISILDGKRITRRQLMEEVRQGTALGRDAVEAEIAFLSDILKELGGEEPEVTEFNQLKEALGEIDDFDGMPPDEYDWIPARLRQLLLRRYFVFAEDTDTTITKAAAQWRMKHLIPHFRQGLSYPILLTATLDNKAMFERACQVRGGVYISGVGHGSPTVYTGYQGQRLLEVGNYDPALVRGKLVHLLSCQTARVLGIDLIRKGAQAYFGYNENFTIVWTKFTELFWRCDGAIDMVLALGGNAGQAARFAIGVYNNWIRELRATNDPAAGPTAVWLTWDRNALRTPIHGTIYGSQTAHIQRYTAMEALDGTIYGSQTAHIQRYTAMEALEAELAEVGELEALGEMPMPVDLDDIFEELTAPVNGVRASTPEPEPDIPPMFIQH